MINLNYKKVEIKKGVKLHLINTEKFKTNLIAIMLSTKLDRKNVTKNALIPAILRRGTQKLKTQEDINKKLEEMYGASLDCGVDKTGDNQVLKFYIETINDNFLPKDEENMLKKSLENMLEIIFNPYTENRVFKKEYVEQEKNNLKQIIEAKADDKARYALNRCIEEMYKDKPYWLYKYGYAQDLENINEKNLFEYYNELINTCKIDIFVSGIIDEKTEKIVEENEYVKKLVDRDADYNKFEISAKKCDKENFVQESMEVTQGKIAIGLDLNISDENQRYATLIYNTILGGSANSKLFQNVREKASLAYTASSNYFRFKNIILINCGIEIANYDKAIKIIKEQIEEMKNGNFTDEDIENAKKNIIAAVKAIDDEQDTEVTYYFGHELSGTKQELDEYINSISKVNKENILNIAKNVSINTIYFLKN